MQDKSKQNKTKQKTTYEQIVNLYMFDAKCDARSRHRSGHETFIYIYFV